VTFLGVTSERVSGLTFGIELNSVGNLHAISLDLGIFRFLLLWETA